jgi:hypothetical protein
MRVGSNFSITPGPGSSRLFSAQRERGDSTPNARPGIQTTAPPGSSGSAALAFPAVASSAFWRIRSANRGI